MRDELFAAVRDVRKSLENPYVGFPSFPRSLCQAESWLLAKYLVEVVGVGPVEGVANGVRLLPEVDEEGPIRQSHFWIEYAGLIIDITADQYADRSEPVIVTADRSWHDQFRGQTRLTQAVVLNVNAFLQKRYAVMREVLSATAL